MIKAVIFDFDYTLGDSTDGIAASANYALEKLGYAQSSRKDISRTIGLPLRETFFRLSGSDNEQEAALFSGYFKEKADEVMVSSTNLYDGVKESLTMLKRSGIKTAIVTSKLRYRIEGILEKFNATELIDLIVGSDDVKVEKPSPEGLLSVIDRFGLNKEDVIYVGDSIVDAKTAENANVSFIGVLTGTTTRQDFNAYKSLTIENTASDAVFYIKNL